MADVQLGNPTADHTLYGAVLEGIDGLKIELQARFLPANHPASSWSRAINLVGLASVEVKETVMRVEGALAKYGINPPSGGVLINLAPAGVPKFGTSLDLPIAVIALQACGFIPDWSSESEQSFVFIGELGLHGDLRRVKGALPMAFVARGKQNLVVPPGNAKEACLIRATEEGRECRVLTADTLEDIIAFMHGHKELTDVAAAKPEYRPATERAPDLADIKGQVKAKRALEIAAAGGHNVLMVGPPGEGKTLLAAAMTGILPMLTNAEKVELTRIYSAKGLLTEDGMVISRRPFRSVHHTASKQALVGGGSGIAEPGEISLAHRGVLFLDELPEFSRATLETLRQPIESGRISISRVAGTLTFPCETTVVAAMNPCPCGYHGTKVCSECMATVDGNATTCPQCGKLTLRPRCVCAEKEVAKYQRKISGPILDRIELKVEVRPLSLEEKFEGSAAESTEHVRIRVDRARAAQTQRFEGEGIPCNAFIPGGEVARWCQFDAAAFTAYKEIVAKCALSTRGTDRLAKVARTIADLGVAERIEEPHVIEAGDLVTGFALA